MKIQVFSDIHNDLRALERNASVEADLYFAAGDLVSWARGLPACGEVLKPLGKKLYVIPGNHESAADIAAFCNDFGFENFHEGVFERDGIQFAGLGYSNPTPFNTPGEYSEDDIEARLAKFEGLNPFVLVCHAPPLETALDKTSGGVHCGSRAVRTFIDTHQPAWFFCGHIHEAAGVEIKMGKTRARNVGPKGFSFEI
jgi:Icc-related predicted phosphoesterase